MSVPRAARRVGLALVLGVAACGPDAAELTPQGLGLAAALPPPGRVTLERAFPRLARFELPTALVQESGGRGRWFLLEQDGRVRLFEDDPRVHEARVLLDLTPRIVSKDYNWEAGLLGLALHPDFQANHQLFLFYVTQSESSPVHTRWVLSRFAFDPERARIDPASETLLLGRDSRYVSYFGGSLVFGPDGYLYVGLGQNVATDTEPHPARTPGDWSGTFLRIDVDRGDPYAIPPDNPYVAGGGAPEVYAYGFRNPWKFSFDRESGRLWAGDVGEDAWEEIDVVLPGRDYGWNAIEGDQCDVGCPPGYQAPVHAYAVDGVAAVIAGHVYRGAAIEALRGVFVFADFMKAEVRGLAGDGAGGWRAGTLYTRKAELRSRGLVGSITSFAEDRRGELLAVTRGGEIFRLVPAGEGGG